MRGRPKSPRSLYVHSDVGNAQRLVALHGADFRYISRLKVWYIWDGKRWVRDEYGTMERWAKGVARGMLKEATTLDGEDRQRLAAHALKSEQAGRIKAMLEMARSEPDVMIDVGQIDQQPMLLCVKNGTVDLRTGKLGPHDRSHLMSRMTDIEYDPSATCPLWIQTLAVLFGGDRALVEYVQRAVGYSLTGDTREQCLHLCIGTGSNGKSTVLDVLEQLSGDYGRQADFQTFLERRDGSGPRPDIARLAGARLVRSSEVGDEKRLNEGLMKSLTGGDTITARFLFSEDFEFKPQFKLWLAANHKPVIRGTDYAIWRRIRLVPFEVTITEEQKDDALPKKLREELPGILTWAVQGCQEWLAEGLRPPERVLVATAEYRSESDIIATFISECCEVGPGYQVPGASIYNAYKRWSEENGERTWTNTKFGRDLSDRGFESKHTMNGKVRQGLRLAHEERPDFFNRRSGAA